jgi:hypothetical protein
MLSDWIRGLLKVLRRIGSQPRSMVAVLMFGGTAMLAACGGDSGGATGGTAIQSPGTGGGSGTAILKVLNAFPTSGTGTLTVITSTSSASPLSSNYRQLVIVGNGTSTNGAALFHRITVDYDPVSGSVLAVTDTWGTSAAAPDSLGATACALVASQNDFQLCNNTVFIDPVQRQITFNNTLLRSNNANTYTSTLSAIKLSFTAL